MTIRDWLVQRVTEDNNYGVELVGPRGFIVKRTGLPDVHAYAVEPSDIETFAPEDLQLACEEMPDLEYVVVVRRRVANSTYPLADEMGVGVGSLLVFKRALLLEPLVARYRTVEQGYIWDRLTGNKRTCQVRRCGYSAYEITRNSSLRSLRIVATYGYELTSDQVYDLVAQHSEIDLDAIVVTNPACLGFPREAIEAGQDAGISILTLRDFQNRLGDEWI